MALIDDALKYANENREKYFEALSEWLRIPSVSTLPQHAADVQAAAEWLAAYLAEIGLDNVAIWPTAGHPVVVGEWLGAGAAAPTVLVYGHYDVQPVDPVEQWRTPPFEPTMVGDDIFCRGVSDDKGQVFLIVAAVEAYLRTAGRLPVNLKFLIEGEEEISSPSLAEVVRREKARLAADAILICDQPMLGPGMPIITYGVRGMTYLEVTVQGPAHDLHSGMFGGGVDNPFNVMAQLLARLVDPETHRIVIPGFYDRVRPLTAAERALQNEGPQDDEVMKTLTGVPEVAGEVGYTSAERIAIRPTLDIHGIGGGFTGEGKKTVIPAEARAKVSMRLVPDQDPDEIAILAEAYLRQLAPPTVTLDVKVLGMARPAVVDYTAPAIQAAAEAYERGLGWRPFFLRSGGTLPIVADFQEILGAPIVMMGFGLPDDNLHAPNEKLNRPNFYAGIKTIIHYLEILSADDAD